VLARERLGDGAARGVVAGVGEDAAREHDEAAPGGVQVGVPAGRVEDRRERACELAGAVVGDVEGDERPALGQPAARCAAERSASTRRISRTANPRPSRTVPMRMLSAMTVPVATARRQDMRRRGGRPLR
jgi:hypothetical protein